MQQSRGETESNQLRLEMRGSSQPASSLKVMSFLQLARHLATIKMLLKASIAIQHLRVIQFERYPKHKRIDWKHKLTNEILIKIFSADGKTLPYLWHHYHKTMNNSEITINDFVMLNVRMTTIANYKTAIKNNKPVKRTTTNSKTLSHTHALTHTRIY